MLSQFQRRNAKAFGVGLPLGFFIGPLFPLILAQKLLRRLAALLPLFNLLGFVVTAVFSLLPGFSRRYALTALLLIPDVLSLRFTFCQSSETPCSDNHIFLEGTVLPAHDGSVSTNC